LTDFGSCIEFKKKQVVKLDELNLPWTRNVASPEMLRFQEFSKASDVFMAIVIIAEMMTADLSDQEFSKQILHRNRSGCVSFSSKPIHNRYAAFFPLLEIGLSNEPTERPTAGTVLEYLVKMKN
jgi:serine/threonine protein kinase